MSNQENDLRENPGSVPTQEPSPEASPSSAEQETSAAGDFYHNPDKVVGISYWAGVLSWIVLAIFIIYALSILYFNYISGAQFMSLAGLSIVLPVLIALVIGGILFVLLQSISHGLLLMLDIAVDIRESVERKTPA